MTVVSVDRDPVALTLTIVARFEAPVERVWQVWADPRQLERWWGPPTHPATVVHHDLRPGGRVDYFMTGPDGTRYGGLFRVLAVDPPHALDLEARYADEHGRPLDDLPTSTLEVRVAAADDGGTTMALTFRYASLADLERAVALDQLDGSTQAVGQLDALLAP